MTVGLESFRYARSFVASYSTSGGELINQRGRVAFVSGIRWSRRMVDITPFRLAVPESELDDLRRRLRQTRWPDRETVDDWSQGIPLDYVRRLCNYWADEYDWRRVERRLNELGQFRTEIDGLGIYFLHVRSRHEDPLPLILTHGWPGSVVEFLKVIGPLTDPTAHGRDARDAFHVVIPSLPGFGFSNKPSTTGWNVERVARAWAELMARLGYDRYGAQGGDWGTSVATVLSQMDSEHVVGIHLNPPLAAPDPDTFDDLTNAERSAIAALANARGSGYSAIQSTRPQTMGYGLVDSPAALCVWIVEKFVEWSDPRSVFTRDELLDNLMLYWLPATGASSARLYWESIGQVEKWFREPAIDTVSMPTGCSIFPAEAIRPSRRWAEKRFTDIRFWSEPERGGHFAAFEQPERFVDDVAGFFRMVR